MKTFIKWPGGKEKELALIREYTPAFNGRYIEPFVGVGAVFFDIKAEKCYLNDKSKDLINLYNCIKTQDTDFFALLGILNREFDSLGEFVDRHKADILWLYRSEISVEAFITQYSAYFRSLAGKRNAVFLEELNKNIRRKIKRSLNLEICHGEIPDSDRLANLESALKSAYYMYVRQLLNAPKVLKKGEQAAVFFFIREFCYSSMFRYNEKGESNVPYGGISYNRKSLKKKIDYLLSAELHDKLRTAEIMAGDFEVFLNRLNPHEDDFIFLDPPYDSDFSTYDQNAFGKEEQIRLSAFLKRTKAKIMLVIKNTDFIYALYQDDFKIRSFDKKYAVSFMNRNKRDTEHLLITNY